MCPAQILFEPDEIERDIPENGFQLFDIKVTAPVIHKNDFDGPVSLGGDTLYGPL